MFDAEQFDRAILLRWLRYGQHMPYADSIYEAELTFTGKNISTRPDQTVIVCGCHPTIKAVKEFVRLLVHAFEEDPAHITHSSPSLDFLKCTLEEPGVSVWRVRVVVPYCD